MPDDLAQFAQQLSALYETERAGQTLLALHGAFENSWRGSRTVFSGQPIPIPPPRGKGLHPRRCEVVDSFIQFTFTLGDIDERKLPKVAEFQVRVTGDANYEHCVIELEDHWRIDTHNFPGSPREPHPLIHFQRGGHAQDVWENKTNFVPGPALPEKNDESWQGLLQSPGPRIPFLPLCPVLAIDYVIGQHDGDVWSKLKGVPEYRKIIKMAQTRLWNPFFEGLGGVELRRLWLGPWLL